MSDTSQMCPSGWTENSFSGLRMCGRPSNAGYKTCVSATFPTGSIQYTQVCGRALGYQYGDPVAFAVPRNPLSIDSYYADGLTLTHGQNGSRQHIWTFANGLSEDRIGRDACPCAPYFSGVTVPSFVGSNYFCESGVSVERSETIFQFHNELLWDGQGCSLHGNTCCELNTPPYFRTRLPTGTSNDIDGRLCGYENRDLGSADTYIVFLELYIKN